MEPKGYTNKGEIENYILNEINETYDDQLDSFIAGVETTIDQITGRNFIADSSATARLYDGDDTQELLIDDCVEVTRVDVGADSYGGTFVEVASSGADRFFSYPANHLVSGVPIRKIVCNSRNFPSGMQNNRVTAKWGYSVEVPADIKFVATVFVAGILNQSRQGGDEVKSERIGNYTVTYNTDSKENSWADFEKAKMILEKYAKINL